MPLMVMPRKWTVRSHFGHTLVFERDKPVSVPDEPAVIEMCVQYGATFADKEDRAAMFARKKEVDDQPKTQTERRERIVELMRKLRDNPKPFREHFTGAGRPHTRYVSDQLGFSVGAPEVDAAWNEVLNEGKDEE